MKKLLLPLILAFLGTGAGIGAGLALRPVGPDSATAEPEGDKSGAKEKPSAAGPDRDGTASEDWEYVEFDNQFLVPVVSDQRVESLMVITLSVEVEPGQSEAVYARQPRLRDALLQTMFDHANMGGFSGTFTDSNTLDVLRVALTETAQSVLGQAVSNVLIADIARQDI